MFSYKVGVVYYDDYNEATTVLSNSNDVENEVYVPFDKRTKINKIFAKINNNPPSWAKKFKFVVQNQKLNYENLYITYGKKIASNIYLKIEGANVNKLKKDDRFFVVNPPDGVYRDFIVSEMGIYDADEGLTEKGFYAKIDWEEDNPLLLTSSGLSDDEIERMVKEAVSVANAEGLGFDEEKVIVGIKTVLANGRGGYTSIYADIKNGNRTEVDTISGSVVEKAKEYGIPVPCHETIIALIHAMENKKKQY